MSLSCLQIRSGSAGALAHTQLIVQVASEVQDILVLCIPVPKSQQKYRSLHVVHNHLFKVVMEVQESSHLCIQKSIQKIKAFLAGLLVQAINCKPTQSLITLYN